MDSSLINHSQSGLTSPLTPQQGKYLLDRTTFGAAKPDIETLKGKTPAEALSVLTALLPDFSSGLYMISVVNNSRKLTGQLEITR
jgi:hypothetical protein